MKKITKQQMAVDWWNERIEIIINPNINEQLDRDKAIFKWSQLVWQEIIMYIDLGKVNDFDWLCDRRGFNEVQRRFLYDILTHIGMKPTSISFQQGD